MAYTERIQVLNESEIRELYDPVWSKNSSALRPDDDRAVVSMPLLYSIGTEVPRVEREGLGAWLRIVPTFRYDIVSVLMTLGMIWVDDTQSAHS